LRKSNKKGERKKKNSKKKCRRIKGWRRIKVRLFDHLSTPLKTSFKVLEIVL
jgi:hypothetical protein